MDKRAAEEPKASEGDATTVKALVECEKVDDVVASITEPVTEAGVKGVGFIIPQELCAESALKFIKEVPPNEIKAEEIAFVEKSQPEGVGCDASASIETAVTTDVLEGDAIRKELESIGEEATAKMSQVTETTEESLTEHIESEKQEGVENIAVSLEEQLEQDIAENKEVKLFQKRGGDSNGLNENLKEKTAEEFVGADDGTESQESMGLVIDEKMDIQEDQQSDGVLTDIAFENSNETARKDRNSKDNERNSCEDTSEASVATQIDANELSNKLKQHLKEEDKGGSTDTAKSATVNVIEIDDDADEKAEQATEREGEEVVIVAEKEIPVIEIDDDEEEVKPESILPAQGITEKQSTSNESLKQVEDVKMDVNWATNDQEKIEKDVEMKDLTTKQEELPTVQAGVEETAATIFGADESNSLLKAALSRRPESPAAATDDNMPEDTRDEVFYKKECINYECSRTHKQYFRVPQFALSYFKVAKKRFKLQYICADCYDKALDMYEEFCGLLTAKQPLLLKDIAGGRQEFVEIIDSSDEEEAGAPVEKEKGGPSFSQTDLDLIEQELEKSIKQVLANVEIQNQLTWSKEMLATRAKRLEEESNFIDAELRSLQKKADNMHVSLYQCPKIKIRQLQPFDLNSGRPYLPLDSEISQLPPIGEIQRFPVQINEMYYAVKNKAIASWVPCKVIEQVEGTSGAQKNLTHYKVKFLKSQYQMLKTVSVKHLAYYDPPPIRLPIGSRVIAYFDASSLSRGKEKMLIQSAFYPGIIAEPLKPNNKYRYLIFYDDGYTQYVSHKDVRLVCSVAENVWEDVHPGSRDFIQKYLTQYSINRPMVQTQKGQSMTTESNGKWIYARVVDIDCSLIQMQFEGPKSHTEWIYRGSLRLGPVFKEYQKTLQKDNMPISRLPRRTEPFIRYTADEEASVTPQQPERSASTEARAVAKKSVSRQESTLSNAAQLPVPTVRHLNNSTIYLEDENKPKGKVVYYTAKRNLPPLTYKPHRCSPSCLFKITHNLNAYSPLSKPLLSGWERLVMRQKIKKVVAYRGPCGKIMRNMKELHHYLRVTQNMLNVDNFDFNHDTNCLAEYVIESAIVQKRDISGGQEKMAIPLVNYYDSTMPPECKYAAQRIPTEGVNLNLDEEFLVGCDCEDDCSDKEKCSCWQLTYAGAKYGNPNTPMDEIGYQYKRLYEHVPTGVYECNSRCKCKSSCLNRVVQHSLQMKLQVFKTSNRGWGLRCINDVPKGSFICIYAGHLLTEAKANEGGLDAGDEYFAELDYIEVAEQIKEGYESDVEPPEPEEDEDVYAPDQDDDDEFTPSKSFLTRSKNKAQKLTRNNAGQIVDEDSQERQVINFNPNADMNENSVRESSIRKLFGKDEACYVMDAKTIGNLGRYFNHSCSPNLFVQNVFVDTHDLRFPWVAFFALTHIRAGTELTWNYNYEVGVVPGKVLYCQCGAPNCRLRLL